MTVMSEPLAAALITALIVAVVVFFLVVVRRNQALRHRPGDVPLRARFEAGGPWIRGHGVWVNDIFAFRRSPAGWTEALLWVTNASARRATDEERHRLGRLGDDSVVATFVLASGGSMAFAARAEDRAHLLGPYA
jgi:hypothetical protein